MTLRLRRVITNDALVTVPLLARHGARGSSRVVNPLLVAARLRLLQWRRVATSKDEPDDKADTIRAIAARQVLHEEKDTAPELARLGPR